MKTTAILCFLIIVNCACARAQNFQSEIEFQELLTAAKSKPASLVGYTMVADNYGKPVHDASLSERAMVLNLDDGKSFEILPHFRLVPRTITAFVGWLPGHRRLMVQRGFFPDAILGVDLTRDNLDLWLDQYIVDLATGRFFTPTAVQTKGYLNAGMMPKASTNDGCCYLFSVGAAQCPATGTRFCSNEFVMHFNGAFKRPFPEMNNTFGSHGCSVSPTGDRMACELPPPCNGAIQPCIQLFDTSTGQQIVRRVGPSPLGVVAWSPDGKYFVYLAGNDPTRTELVLINATTGESDRLGGDVVHIIGPGIGGPDDDSFNGGSELGQWSADSKAFYISTLQYSGPTPYNRIGRVLLSDKNTFVPLTPVGTNARYPSPAPNGSAFVYIAISAMPKKGEGAVQIYKVEIGSDGKPGSPEQETHLPLGWVANYPAWREITNIRVDPLP
jgi:hypothetical protein